MIVILLKMQLIQISYKLINLLTVKMKENADNMVTLKNYPKTDHNKYLKTFC